jgi:hypothetical protein
VLQPSQASSYESGSPFNALDAGYGLDNSAEIGGLGGGILRQTEVVGAFYTSPLFEADSTPAWTCEEDSGGPLIAPIDESSLPVTTDPMPSNGHWAVIGTTSFGDIQCDQASALTPVADSTSTHTLLLTAPAGTDNLTFQGRLSSSVKLAHGSYTVTASATSASGKASAAWSAPGFEDT